MSAPRDTGWTHTRLVGDRDQAQAHVPDARKLLGYARQQAGYMGLGTYKVSQQLLDGTSITAELHGGIPRITIDARADRQPRLVRLKFNGFVVWARSNALPNGIDPEFPQQLIRGRGAEWRTYTKGGVSTGNSDGTYGGRFIKGLKRAGNVDWVSLDGERISWYGGSSRMFLDPYQHPRHWRGKFVFHLGEPLLDVEEYIAESLEDTPFPDRYIAGAALARREDGLWLYTVQTLGADGNTTSPIPSEAVFDYPLAPQGAGGGLHRYGLTEYITPEGLKRYKVKKNSREKLQNLAIGHDDAWFFNQSCTQFVAHGALPPDSTGFPWHVARIHQDTGTNALDPTDVPPAEFFPSAIHNRYLRSVDGGGTVTAYSVVSGGAAVPLAADFDGDILRQMTIRLGADLVPYLGFDGIEVPTYLVVSAGGDLLNATQRWVLCASPRDRFVLLLGENRIFDRELESPGAATAGEGIFIEAYLDGIQINRTILYPPAPTIPSGGLIRFLKPNAEMFESLEGRSISPSWFIYGILQRIVDSYAPPPDDEDTWTTETTFIGINPGYRNLARPAECYFGLYSPAADDLPVPLSTLVAGAFAGNQADEDGNYAITGFAMERNDEGEPEVVLSVAIDSTGVNATFGLTTIGPLGELTGVSGPGERYHPVWALGRAFFERTEE